MKGRRQEKGEGGRIREKKKGVRKRKMRGHID